MFAQLHRQWRSLKSSAPGHRFQDRYKREHSRPAGRSKGRGILMMGAGIVLLVGGVVFLVMPGPGLPMIAIGGALLAGRSHRFAVVLDWTELKARRFFAKIARTWHHASGVAKSAVVTGAMVVTASALYVSYRLVF